MSDQQHKTPNSLLKSRRSFLRQSGTAMAVGSTTSALAPAVHAAGDDTIRVALIGCGGRGRGAIAQIFNTKGNTRLVAVADAFAGQSSNALDYLREHDPSKVDVPEERRFTGLDAYKKAIDTDCDLVVIATPPGFKPQQFEYAVDKGKHIFMEKPLAVDAPGVRRCLAAVELSKQQGLMVAIGLQRRHEPQYIETVKRIQDGAIGDVLFQRVYWNSSGIWYRERKPGQSEMAFQINNWYHFLWTGGDQICEQHIHNLDVGCWIKDDYPIEANGMGGWAMREGGDRSRSQIFDHTFCEFTFSDGSKMYSQGRHLPGSWTAVTEFAHGTKGTAVPSGRIEGPNAWQFSGQRLQGHQQEQHDLIEALMRGEIYNEGEYGAKSSFTSILGREACFSGKIVKWDELLEQGKDYAPGIDQYTLQSDPPVARDENGQYPGPIPGLYSPFA